MIAEIALLRDPFKVLKVITSAEVNSICEALGEIRQTYLENGDQLPPICITLICEYCSKTHKVEPINKLRKAHRAFERHKCIPEVYQ